MCSCISVVHIYIYIYILIKELLDTNPYAHTVQENAMNILS